MFRLLFYPIRLIRQHWLFSLTMLAALYLVLGFSHFGRTFVHRINPMAQTYNDRFVAATRTSAIRFFGIEPVANKIPATNDGMPVTGKTSVVTAGEMGKPAMAVAPPANPMFRVSAAKGLNLRTEPLQTSPRIDLALLLLHQLDAANHTLAGLTLEADAAYGTALSDAKREAGDKDRISSLVLQNRLLEEEIRRLGDTGPKRCVIQAQRNKRACGLGDGGGTETTNRG